MKRVAALVVGLTLILALMFALADAAGWTAPERFQSIVESAKSSPGGRAAAAMVIVGLLAADLVLPVPSSVLMTLSGAMLGAVFGTMTSFAGAMASALLGFALCRRFGRAAFNRLAGDSDRERVERFLRTHGAWGILLSRSVPMLTEIVSCLAGLSGMSAGLFAGLSAAGTLPLCWVYAWAGASAADPSGMGVAVALAFVLPALGWGLFRLLHRSPRNPPD